MSDSSAVTAIILAGDRGPHDPVAAATGAPCKALAPVAGQRLVERVTQVLSQAPSIDALYLVGPTRAVLDKSPDGWASIKATGATWIEPGTSPATSAAQALKAIPVDQRILLTSVDHALLRVAWVEQVIAEASTFDFTAAVVAREALASAYPDARPTTIRLGPGAGFCTANLFTVQGSKGRDLIARWRQFEAERKHPARYMGRLLGPVGTLAYLLGRLTLNSARQRLSQRLGMDLGISLIDDAEAAIDVDSAADLALAEGLLSPSD